MSHYSGKTVLDIKRNAKDCKTGSGTMCVIFFTQVVPEISVSMFTHMMQQKVEHTLSKYDK